MNVKYIFRNSCTLDNICQTLMFGLRNHPERITTTFLLNRAERQKRETSDLVQTDLEFISISYYSRYHRWGSNVVGLNLSKKLKPMYNFKWSLPKCSDLWNSL